MQSRFSKIFSFIGSIKPAKAALFGGITLTASGVGLHDLGAGLATAGILLLLSLNPLSGWVK